MEKRNERNKKLQTRRYDISQIKRNKDTALLILNDIFMLLFYTGYGEFVEFNIQRIGKTVEDF